jgi:hypothetical protein
VSPCVYVPLLPRASWRQLGDVECDWHVVLCVPRLQVKQRLGGNVKLLVSGGAPLAPHVEDFLKVAMCAPVVQVGHTTLHRCFLWQAGVVQCAEPIVCLH